MHLHGLRGLRPFNGRQGQRTAVWLQVKVRRCGNGLEPRLYACSVCDTQHQCRSSMRLYKCYAFTWTRHTVNKIVIFMLFINHSVNSSSHSVNGDIAIQWEWSNFDPSQNPNPLTDYDKTLHNWLRPREEHVNQNLCQSAIRERLAKYTWNIRPLFFTSIFFPRTRLLK